MSTESNRNWRKKHPDKARELARRLRANNLDHANHLSKMRQRNTRMTLKSLVMAVYSGGRCACCGETELSFLTIDHINNDGAKHRKEVGKKAKCDLYRLLKQEGYPEGFQVLCANCNMSKAINGGICAHQIKQEE